MAIQHETSQCLVDNYSTLPSHSKYASQLFENGLFSDCTILAGSRRWHLHRAILAQRCQFFRACFSNGFRESRYDHQAGSAEVKMHEDDPDALGRMLKWLYTMDYPSVESEGSTDDKDQQDGEAQTALHPRFWTSELALLVVSDKYDLTDLADQASASICSTAAHCSWKAIESNADSFPGSIDDFVDMVELLYMDISSGSTSAQRLQQDLLKCSAMMIASQAVQHPRLSQLVSGIPELAKDLVEALRQTIEAQHQHNNKNSVPRSTTGTLKSASRPRTSRSPRTPGSWSGYRSGSESEGSGSGRSPSRAASRSPTPVKQYIPMNEDSEME